MIARAFPTHDLLASHRYPAGTHTRSRRRRMASRRQPTREQCRERQCEAREEYDHMGSNDQRLPMIAQAYGSNSSLASHRLPAHEAGKTALHHTKLGGRLSRSQQTKQRSELCDHCYFGCNEKQLTFVGDQDGAGRQYSLHGAVLLLLFE